MKFEFLNILWFTLWVYLSADPIKLNDPSNEDKLKLFFGI